MFAFNAEMPPLCTKRGLTGLTSAFRFQLSSFVFCSGPCRLRMHWSRRNGLGLGSYL
jgi:hypothetical protein